MRLKFLAFVVFGLIFISLGIVSAACPSSDDTIMKLYNASNSHGALWNDTDYKYDICYSDVFGEAWSGADYHPANCTAPVVWLQDITNSHAENPNTNSYSYPVCYGDLECEEDVSAGSSCSNGGGIVVRLYQNTNSHISNASDSNYPVKICCKQVTRIMGAYWANMLENPINRADLNDRVKLMVPGIALTGANIEYEIWKIDGLFWFFDSKVAEISEKGFTTWRAGKKQSDGILNEGDYYFKARIEGGEWLDSRDVGGAYGILIVPNIENNSPPVANITSPQVGEIYYTGEDVNFEHASYDEDDEIASVLWDFGDGGTSEDDSVVHAYSITKQKQIKLTVTDERDKEGEDRTSILIISPNEDNNYVFAHIDEPKWGDNFFGYEISFSAESSYAINTTGCSGTCTINCLGGKCPFESEPYDYSNLTFSWKFDGGISGVKKSEGDEGKAFTWLFGHPGRHAADLTVSIVG